LSLLTLRAADCQGDRHIVAVRRNLHPDIPSLSDLHEAVELALFDRREGFWTRLELLEMDERFCQVMRRAHPELLEPVETERRKRA
jgi:hypothetical protein